MSTKKKILVISESIDVEDSSASKGRVALIYNLSKIGYNVKVLHYTRKEVHLDGVECVSIKELKFNVNYVLSRTQRVLQRFLKVNFSEFLENIFGHSFTFFNDSRSISKAVDRYYTNENLIVTLSKGASFRPHHAMLKLSKFHNKWMAYVHDPYPFHCYPRPYDWVESGFKYKEKFFREVSEKARFSAFPSLMLQQWMGDYFPNFLKTGIVLPHQNPEGEEIINLTLPAYFDELKFSMLHAGNLMNTRPPLALLEAYKIFIEEVPDARDNAQLLLIGNTNFYEDEVKKYEVFLPVYCSHGYLPFSEVNELQKKASVSLIIESKASISPFLPGKFPYCISANKPIFLLGPYYSESRRLLGKEYPYVSEVDDVIEIKNIIKVLYANWKKSNGKLRLNRDDLELYVSKEYLKEQLETKVFIIS